MVGAEDDEFVAAGPVLAALAGEVLHVGPPSTGTIAKIINNQLFLAAGVLVQEAYVLGAALGMEPADPPPRHEGELRWPTRELAPLLLGRRFDDVIFRLDIAAKDVGLAVDSAAKNGVDVPLTCAAADVPVGHRRRRWATRFPCNAS
ncbi:MAG: NAD-binding protein [Acidimicrobiales bacterium]